jgi:hypothetical protein
VKLCDISAIPAYRKELVLRGPTLTEKDTYHDPIDFNAYNATPRIPNLGMFPAKISQSDPLWARYRQIAQEVDNFSSVAKPHT